jgi:Na+-translocating ferredoxin:NAD+ oxidoreductase RnfD subunit
MSFASARRFFRTPKGLALLAIGLLAVIATVEAGPRRVGPVLAAGILVAMLADAPLLRWRDGEWVFPSGALLTGLIVAMILSPYQPWYIAATTSAVAIASKYLVRIRTANVFNPAALALVLTFYVFHAGHSWWGALPDAPPIALVALFGTGIFICHRVNKVPAVLAFLGVYYLLVTITAFAGDPARVADLYRAPDLQAALYFAFFMVTDPPTSPPKHRDQIVFGVIVAVASYATFEVIGAAYFLLAGLLVANAWEAWRRVRARAERSVRDVVAA